MSRDGRLRVDHDIQSGESVTQVIDEFLNLLENSRLVPADKIAAAVEAHNLHELASAKDVARKFVKAGLITRFQAERLLQGRCRGFFIDEYKVLEILGVGGMGNVYVAENIETGQKVALKVLTEAHQVDPGMLARMKLEARAGSKLDHPHIVSTSKFDHTGAVCYLIMEFVQGISLFELITLQGPLPWPQACDVVRQAALGLQHAHERGIIHRDIKPENLLIDRNGIVKILDFGLALLRDDAEAEFSLAMIFGQDCLGTADYISPEQSRDSQTVDARTDIYSLGCTMYVALTGKLPFPYEKTPQKIEAQRTKQPRPLQELVPKIPDEVATLVGKMMAKQPGDRFSSAAEVAHALEAVAQRKPIPFDFPAILTMRAADARARIRARRKGTRKSGTTTSSTARTSISSTTRRPRSECAIDTMFSGDTQPLLDESSPNLSFEALREQRAAAAEPLRPNDPPAENAKPIAMLISQQDGRKMPLTSTRFLIGRDKACDLSLALPGISGRHCELSLVGNTWRVTDLDSKGGIEINGQSLKEGALEFGDRLTIARNYHFCLEDPYGPPEKASPWGSLGLYAGIVALLASLGGLLSWLVF